MKVIIVDDEVIVRVGLKSLINWQENGFELIGEASNGEKAMELIIAQKPEIAIVDMKMPIMNGIELMHRLEELCIMPRILVISGYDDFHLVREAMKLGAEDYLLKLDISPESLIMTLKKIALNIELTNQRENIALGNDKLIIENTEALSKKFLKDILNNFYRDKQGLNELMEKYGVELKGKYIYCFIIKVGELYRFEETSYEDLRILYDSIINISEEIINYAYRGYCFEGKTGEFFIVASKTCDYNLPICDEKLIEISKLIKEMLEQYLNITATIGIGGVEGGIDNLNQAYKFALMANNYRFFKGSEGVILWKDIRVDECFNDEHSIMNKKDRLHKALSFHEEEKMKEIFDEVISILNTRHLSKNGVHSIALELFYMVSEFFEIFQLDIKQILKKSYRSYSQIINLDSKIKIQEWIYGVMGDLNEFIRAQNKIEYSRIIARVQKYIETHFNENISLSEVANSVNLNPSYLSTMLKKYIGLSYTDYLAEVRVRKAKELMENTDYKIYEVGERVGYNNEYYFNRVFKKHIGISPGEYRRSLKVQ